MRAATATRPGAAFTAVKASQNASHRHRIRSSTAVSAESGSNPFAKLGTQFAKVGSQLTATLSGTAKVGGRRGRSNDTTVFIAGATGRLGSRIVKQALEAGYRVRAGCRSQEKGEELIEMLQETDGLTSNEKNRLQIVEFDLFDEDTIQSAIGNAGAVISALGAPESKVFDVSGPKKIDGDGATKLIKTARDLGVKRFIMVTSLGTTKFGWPASALNLFWGILYWKAQSEAALLRSGMAYTIVRPGGMERPKDDYKETHNTVLAPRDTYFGNQISRLQVAEVVGACLAEPELSGNKVLEAVALDDAPRRDLEDLLATIDPEVSLEEMAERNARAADARNRVRSLEAEAEKLEQDLAAVEERKVTAEDAYSSARGELQEVQNGSRNELRAMQQSESQLKQLQQQLDSAKRQEEAAKAVLSEQRSAGREGKVLSRNEIRDIQQPILNPPAEDESDEEAVSPSRGGSGGGGGFLGSLFGASAKATAEDAQDAVEEVEDEVEQAPRKAAGGLRSLFGSAKDAAAEAEEEVVTGAPVAKRGLGSFFGGAKDAAAEAEEAAERAAPAAPQRAAKQAASGAAQAAKGAAKGAAKEAEKAEQEVEDTAKKTVKGGGLFGMFQQDTVYAGESSGSDPAATPSKEEVERFVTKRGMGKRKPRKSAQGGAARPAQQAAKKVEEAAPQAAKKVEQAASAAKQEAPKAAEKVEEAAEDVAETAKSASGGGLGGFGGLFSGLQKAFDSSSSQDSNGASSSGAASSSGRSGAGGSSAPASPKKAESGAASRRAKAIGSALKGLEDAADDEKEGAPKKAEPAQAEAAKPETAKNGTGPDASAYEGREGAQQWIKQWRQKEKA